MSGTIDEEIVRMRFDTSSFERGVSTTLGLLSRLKNSLSFSGADKGLDQIESKANKFSLQGMSSGIDGVSKKFLALSTIGITALSNITNRAINAGITMVKSFTIAPIAEGFKSYETQINAAKIIIANTGAKLPEVEGQLAQLQTYANQTVYSFSDMAQNIGTFTAAGVKLVPAVSAIKGMGNTAALSGANVQQLNSAMYQMSQAMSSGVIRLQDWNSLSNANMGGQNIQKVLMATASTIKGTGPKMDDAIKKYGNFRNSLTAGWLTADVFSKSMGIMAGTVDKATGKTRAFTVAELKAKGYTAAHAVELHKLSQAAIDSATQIRTYSQLTDALKEEVASAWGRVFKTIFGNVDGATKMFTALHTVLENAFTGPINKLNDFLIKIKKLGGITSFINGIKNIFHALSTVMGTVTSAFREIFPAKSAASIVLLINKFEDFTKKLQMSSATAAKVKQVFAGIFAVFDIGKQIVMGIFHVFGQLFGTISQGSGGLLTFIAHIASMVVAFDKALKSGDVLHNLFRIIANVLTVPIHLIHLFTSALGSMFSSFHPKKLGAISGGFGGLSAALERVAHVTDNIGGIFDKLQSKIRPAMQAIGKAMQKLGEIIANGLNSEAFGNILKGLQTGLLAGILLTLKKFMSGGVHIDVGKGIFGQAKEALEGVTGSLKAMQTQLKAKALLEIAIAMGVIAASIVLLAYTNPKKVEAGLKAMAIGFGELLAAMAILTKISGSAGFIKMPLIAASLDMLAGAILLLSIAVIALSRLSWQELEKGLTAVGLLLAGLAATSAILSATSGSMIRSGIGIAAMAVGLDLLYLAVKGFSMMSWPEMLRGLAGVGIALAGIAAIMHVMPKGMVLQSAAILAISVALNALYFAVKDFSKLSYGEMIKGLVGIGGALAAIALAMKLMPPGMIAQALALTVIAAALQGIDRAVASMSKLSWSEIGKGLAGLAGALVVLAGGLLLMEGSLGGAAALLIVAGALHIFVPVLQTLGSMSWGTMLKGFVGLAAAFAIIGVAGLLLAPVIPAILGLGLALTLVGVAMAAFGAGAALLGIGLTAIAASGGAAIGVLLSGLKGFLLLLPVAAKSLATALVSFITIIGSHAPQIIGAFVSLLNSLLQAVPKLMPGLIVAITSLVTAILTVLVQNAPRLIAAGFDLLMDLLRGISNNIGRVTIVVVDIITKFLNTLANNIGRIVQAGVNLLFKFLEGVARAAGRVPGEAIKIIFIFIGSLFGQFGKIFSAGVSMVGKLLGGIGSLMGSIGSMGWKIITTILGALGRGFGNLVSMGGRLLRSVISGIGNGIANAASDVAHFAVDIGKAIVNGIKNGIGDIASSIGGMLKRGLGGLVHGAADFLGIGGPSMLFSNAVGSHIPEGIAHGIDKNSATVINSVRAMGKASVTEMKKTMDGLGQMMADSNMEYSPTITPILDLSQVQKDAGNIAGIVSAAPVSAALSYSQASGIASLQAAKAEAEASAPPAPPAEIKFEQNNYSPEALSTLDIYRQTHSLLSTTKKRLGVPQ